MIGQASLPLDRVVIQIGVARQLALNGRSAPARRLCSTLFLEELPRLSKDGAILQLFIEALLLLQMSPLLSRLLQAAYGAEVEIVRLGGLKSRRWTMSFGNGVILLITPPGPWMQADLREAQSAIWARRIVETATSEMVPAEAMLEAV